MSQDDRYHTTSWDGRDVSRQSRSTAPQRPAPQQPQRAQAPKENARPASPGAKKKKAGRQKRMNPLLSVVLWVVIVAVSSVAIASFGWTLAQDFAGLTDGTPAQSVEVKITEDYVKEVRKEKQKDGSVKDVTVYDMHKIADLLEEKGLIEYPWFFRLFNSVYHGEAKIRQGTYQLHTEMDYMALIRGMRGGNGQAVTVNITIPEGYNVKQVIQLLAENGVGSEEKLTNVAANYVFKDFAFIDNEHLGDISRLEGYLYPDTYNFYVGGDPVIAIKSMLSNFDNKIYKNDDLVALLEGAPVSLNDVITVASLIEKETDGTDREKIASVIYNRLSTAGETAYYLQIDAALVYAAGREITQEDYSKLDSPYNLYLHTGLPPTPIANPGLASIRAALQPANTKYFYYFLGADGKHVFSETLKQHNDAMAKAKKG